VSKLAIDHNTELVIDTNPDAQDNVCGAVIMIISLWEFTCFFSWM